MTMVLPVEGRADKWLKRLGKRRAYRLPPESLVGSFGAGGYFRLIPESFFSALLRPRGRPLPPGWVYRVMDVSE